LNEGLLAAAELKHGLAAHSAGYSNTLMWRVEDKRKERES
jgi:hypothetical protein